MRLRMFLVGVGLVAAGFLAGVGWAGATGGYEYRYFPVVSDTQLVALVNDGGWQIAPGNHWAGDSLYMRRPRLRLALP